MVSISFRRVFEASDCIQHRIKREAKIARNAEWAAADFLSSPTPIYPAHAPKHERIVSAFLVLDRQSREIVEKLASRVAEPGLVEAGQG